ncbi:inactive ubiquitin carboxyl-terminal hydrolase MINDY-4B [Xenopus laevis]|uniref:Ubiquitin carboxyl-terminal hydrolase MINDY n=1 Tax=Xenopus laevis TaxID=8355 RepID=A0A8J0VE99_XENLA|nr:inactive ubiquitin carboxyl-terminal hydrolase MINDY-4B [Xenopus laevis]
MDKREAQGDLTSPPRMELDEITSKINDLDKWRSIFSSQGLEVSKAMIQKSQENQKADEESEEKSDTLSIKKHGYFPANILYSIPKEFIVAADLGGYPISIEMAVELRKILFGNTFYTFNYEWKKSFFKFREPFTDMAYSLEADKTGTRAIQMAVQGHIIKYLLFTKHGDEHNSLQNLYEHSQKQQERALAVALADILWTAGEGNKAIICLITNEPYFTQGTDYKADHFTERLQLFEFVDKEILEKFLGAHIHCFKNEGCHGMILFLYSLLFSRTLRRLQDDLDFTTPHLLQFSLGNFSAKQALINLMLTGRASPQVFNGDQVLDEDNTEHHVQHGVLVRSDIGFLHWSREEMQQDRLPRVGSMLKTPKFPIWLCNVNGTYSVLFGINASLLCDWKMEHFFDLYFYNGQLSQRKTAHLTIDTHSHHWEERSKADEGDMEKKFPSVEMTVRTKWEGASINWHGSVPFY